MKFLSLFLLFLLTKVLAAKNKDESMGPFRSILVSVRPCENTTYPLKKDPQIQINMWTTNSETPRVRLLSGNITVVKETKQVRIKIKSYTWEDGKWKLSYLMNSITCRGLMLNLIIKHFGFNIIDASRCAYLKGSYSFADINLNTMQHLMASRAKYGQTLWRSEMNVGFFTYYCWETHTMVEPI